MSGHFFHTADQVCHTSEPSRLKIKTSRVSHGYHTEWGGGTENAVEGIFAYKYETFDFLDHTYAT